MGRSSSSSSSSNSTTVHTTNYALQGDNEGVAVMGNNNRVSQTDHGAIDAAFELGEKSLFTADAALSNALAFGQYSVNESMGAVSDLSLQQADQNREQIEAIQELAENVQTGGQSSLMESNTTMMKGMLAAITVVIVVLGLGAMFKGKK